MATSVLRLPNVVARTGLSRSTIYLHMKRNAFPKCIALGPRAVGWLESDIEDWINERIDQGRVTNEDGGA